ncbi:MAG: SDR family oxidoreductase [Chloroflexi bacterium]|nr:SDR family oxidoreductase [Chloroflexota bacterium]
MPTKGTISLDEMFNMAGKVAVVIGGARDLGLDMAEILAEAGCDLAITSRTRESAEKTAAKLRAQYGRDVLPDQLDICDYSQVAAFAEKVKAWKGRVDVLINNAGGGLGLKPTNLFERPPEHIAQLINTNLTGVLYCCKAFGQIMAQQGSGSIINIASIAGLVGRDRRMYNRNSLGEQPIDYAAAKAGILGLTMDLAGFLSPMGVRVNAISPGGFERGQSPAFIDAYSQETPMGRMGQDGVDLKGAALFLASPASGYVTGQNLVVDGGFVIWK